MYFVTVLQQPLTVGLAKTKADIAKKNALIPTRLVGGTYLEGRMLLQNETPNCMTSAHSTKTSKFERGFRYKFVAPLRKTNATQSFSKK